MGALARRTVQELTSKGGASSGFDSALRGLHEEAGEVARAASERIESLRRRQKRVDDRLCQLGALVHFLRAERQLSELDGTLSGGPLREARRRAEAGEVASEVLRDVAEAAGEVAGQGGERVAEELTPALGRWFGRLSRHASLVRAELVRHTERRGGTVRNAYTIRARDEAGE